MDASKELKRLYPGVDYLKLLFAISIVFTHTYCHDFGFLGSMFINVVSVTGVPFFFICSGFFLKAGLDRHQTGDEKKKYYYNYVVRLLKMYVSWTIITIPVAIIIINSAYPESSVVFKCIYWIRMLFLSGSLGVYWYILALIISSFLLYHAEKKGSTLLLFIVSLIFFVWGELYNSSCNKGQPYFEWIHVLFSSTRNFLNMGLFYMLLGFFLSNRIEIFVKNTISVVLLLVLSLVLRLVEISFFHTSIGVVFLALLCFIAAVSTIHTDVNTVLLRRLSIGLYMIHFPVILLLDFYLKKGTVIDFTITIVISLALYFIIDMLLPKKMSRVLLG